VYVSKNFSSISEVPYTSELYVTLSLFLYTEGVFLFLFFSQTPPVSHVPIQPCCPVRLIQVLKLGGSHNDGTQNRNKLTPGVLENVLCFYSAASVFVMCRDMGCACVVFGVSVSLVNIGVPLFIYDCIVYPESLFVKKKGDAFYGQ
jgi:hypothetical protein